MNQSWLDALDNLGILAFTQFDAQFQEASRSHCYTSEISSVLNRQSLAEPKQNWQNGGGYKQAGELAFKWIQNSPKEYFASSFKHLLGLLFGTPLMTFAVR